MGINEAFQILIGDLCGSGIEHPAGEYFTLATIWHDLAKVAGEAIPAGVAKLIDSPPPKRQVSAFPKLVYPCQGCGTPIEDDGGVCDECAGFEEPYPCEGCGQQGGLVRKRAWRCARRASRKGRNTHERCGNCGRSQAAVTAFRQIAKAFGVSMDDIALAGEVEDTGERKSEQ